MTAKEESGELSQRRCQLGRTRRLTSEADFERVFSGKLSAADSRLVVYAWPNDLGCRRVGLGVGKKVGAAVRRNRCKRLLREAFRLAQHELPAGYDYVLIPRGGPEPSVHLYRQSLMSLCGKLASRHQRRR